MSPYGVIRPQRFDSWWLPTEEDTLKMMQWNLHKATTELCDIPRQAGLSRQGVYVFDRARFIAQYSCFITRGQLWPSGIVVACVCLCVCVCVYVCVSVNHQFVRTITCHPLKLQSPNLDQKCKTPWLRCLLFLGFIDLDLQGQIELKSQNLPHFGLVSLSGRQVNTKWSEAFQIWTKNAS